MQVAMEYVGREFNKGTADTKRNYNDIYQGYENVQPLVYKRGNRLGLFWKVTLMTLASGRDEGREGVTDTTDLHPACCTERVKHR